MKRQKKKSRGLNVQYHVGDMRKSKFGKFDACIAILNTIAILSQEEFKVALDNISNNLVENGFFIFDCTNKKNLLHAFYNEKFLETASEIGTKKVVRFVEGNFNKETGIAKWDWEVFIQDGFAPLLEKKGSWIRQTYTREEISDILTDHGFRILQLLDRNLDPFNMDSSAAFLVIAQKEE